MLLSGRVNTGTRDREGSRAAAANAQPIRGTQGQGVAADHMAIYPELLDGPAGLRANQLELCCATRRA